MTEIDDVLFKNIYNKGYKACLRGEPHLSPYAKHSEKSVIWRQGYDAAKKKHTKKIRGAKYEIGKAVEAPKKSSNPRVKKGYEWKQDMVSEGGSKPAHAVESKKDLWEQNGGVCERRGLKGVL